MQYLLVKFADDRGVIINGAPGAWKTNQKLQFAPGTYTISLEAPLDFAPLEYKVVLLHTTVIVPKEVTFFKTARL